MSNPQPRSLPPRSFPLTGVNLRLLMTLGILFIDVVLLATGRLAIHGASDEIAHLLTALLWGVLALSVGLPVSLPFVALGGVFPDLDHVPMFLLGMESLPGSSRSILHTLLVILIFLDLAWWNRRLRWLWGSMALGVASHLVRDMATGTVILLWPLSGRPFSIPYLAYLGTLVLCIALPAFMPRRAGDKPVERLRRQTGDESNAPARHHPIDTRSRQGLPDFDAFNARPIEQPQPAEVALTPSNWQQ